MSKDLLFLISGRFHVNKQKLILIFSAIKYMIHEKAWLIHWGNFMFQLITKKLTEEKNLYGMKTIALPFLNKITIKNHLYGENYRIIVQ